MTSEELYNRIDLQPEIRKKLCDIAKKINLEQINDILEQMQEAQTAEAAYRKLCAFLAEDEGNMKMLYCQLECVRRVHETYQDKGIPGTIFQDTMKCFPRFLEECQKKHGLMFFDRGWWTYRQISMTIFRIGELEYERKEKDDEKIISIHIPSDADLSKEPVDESLDRAGEFFRIYYPEWTDCRYTCNSWLLSPTLKSMLPETSRIRSFQNRFEMIRENKDDREYMEWLFQVPVDTDPKDLPVGTSLQRNAKKYILEGGNIGSAFGILKVLSE